MAYSQLLRRGARERRWIPGALIATTFLAPTAARAEPIRDEPAPLAVRVYDLGGVDSAALADALREARVIFAAAGMASTWHDCTRGARSSSPFCGERRQPTDLVVRIVRRPETEGLSKALGASVVESGIRSGVLATVFLDLVESVARRTGGDVPVLIGRAIAHEVGHLLLGTGEHSASGLMRPIWTDRELASNNPRDWLFEPGEGAVLRAARRRVEKLASAPPDTFSTERIQDTSAR